MDIVPGGGGVPLYAAKIPYPSLRRLRCREILRSEPFADIHIYLNHNVIGAHC